MENAPQINYTNSNCISFTIGADTWFVSYNSTIVHIQEQQNPRWTHRTDFILVALGDDYNRSKTTSRHLNAMLDDFVDKHRYCVGRPVYIRKEDLSPNYQRFAEYNGLVDLSTMDNPHRRSILDDFYLNQIKKQRSDD